MIRYPPLASAVGRLHEAALAAEAIPFEAVGQAVGASYTLLFSERTTDGKVESPLVQGVDQAYGTRLQHAATERLLPGWLRGLHSGIVVDRAALQRDHDFAHSAFFDYVVRPEGRFHCLITTPYVTPTHRYHLIVGRPFNRTDFTPVDIGALQALMPFIGRLIATEREAARVKDKADGLASAFDCMSANVLILSPHGGVEFANTGAKRLLGLRDGLHLANAPPASAPLSATLTAADPVANSKLQRAVSQVMAIDGPSESELHLPRPSGCAPFHVMVRRLSGTTDPLFPHAATATRAMVVIQELDPQEPVNGWSIGQIYGLTAKELEIAVLLSRGQDLRSAAATLGISYNTARCHLRHAYEKMDVHHQGDLVRMVLNASPRLRR